MCKLTVSSTLNKNHKDFGKKHLIDGKEETCWNSDQGLPQFVSASFLKPHKVSGFSLTAQGGFCPKEIVLYIDDGESERFEATDCNN